MLFDATFLRTKVARRILLLFVLCALMPITVLAFLSLQHVNRELSSQARARIRQTSKGVGLSVFERLLLVDAQMQLLVSTVRGMGEAELNAGQTRIARDRLFEGLFIVTPQASRIVFGAMAPPPKLSAQQQRHLNNGGSILITQPSDGKPPRILVARLVDADRPNQGVLWGHVAHAYLWEEGNLPPDTEMCVMQEDGLELHCPEWIPPGFTERTAAMARREPLRQFEWEGGGNQYLAAGWPLFLRAQFEAPGWLLVLSEPKAKLLAPIASFKKSFGLVVLLSLWIVLLLSNVQIRRNMHPLERLKAATQSFSLQEFDTPVQVKSDDEFEELADSFNSMASRLRLQFNALSSSNHIDRAILSALDRDRIIETVLQRAPELVPTEAVMVGVLVGPPPTDVRTHLRTHREASEIVTGQGTITLDQARQIRLAQTGFTADAQSDFPDYLGHLTAVVPEIAHWVVFPIQVGPELAGLLAFGQTGDLVFSADDRTQAQHLADQLAVAFANANLVEQLESLHLGALTALARVIDAKSSWTAGHSERVADLSLRLAQRLELPASELEIIRRGALLHDIGKIGVSSDILDKPGQLTADEMASMRQHVTIGARILEPIPQCADIIPIVLHHHERIDGRGYPHGLTGHSIPLLARIVCVADCYDALASERPYRRSLPNSVCCEVIERGRGTEFDPVVVDALFALLAENEGSVTDPSELAHV